MKHFKKIVAILSMVLSGFLYYLASTDPENAAVYTGAASGLLGVVLGALGVKKTGSSGGYVSVHALLLLAALTMAAGFMSGCGAQQRDAAIKGFDQVSKLGGYASNALNAICGAALPMCDPSAPSKFCRVAYDACPVGAVALKGIQQISSDVAKELGASPASQPAEKPAE